MIKHCYALKVYYKDIDQMGIVYYSRYFEYFEEARTEMLAAIGLKYSEVEAQGFMLPVIEAHAEYKKGASFEQEIVIETKIFEPPKARLKIQYDVKLKEGDDLLMKGYTIHAFTNRAGRPVKAPKHILNVINPYFN